MDSDARAEESAPAPRGGRALPRWAWALVLGALAAVGAFLLVASWERGQRREDLARLVSARAHSLEERIRLASALLATVQGFSDGCGHLKPRTTTAYLDTLATASGGWATLSWVPLVGPGEFAGFETLAREYGHPPTGVRRRDAGRWTASEPAGDHAPLVWASPPSAAESLLGWDLLSHPDLAPVLRQVRGAGDSRLTAAVALPLEGASDEGPAPAVALVRPVYRFDRDRATAQEREAALLGWVVAFLGPTRLLAAALDSFAPAGIETYLLDRTGDVEVPIAALGSRLGPHDRLRAWGDVDPDAVRYGVPLQVPGRDWELVGVATDAFLSTNWPWHAWAAALAVLLLSGAAAASLRSTARRVEEARLAVAKATADLERSNENLRIQVAARRAGGLGGGSLAHEVNNVLMGVLGNAELALLDLGADDPLRTRLEDVRRGATQAAELVRGAAARRAATPSVPADAAAGITASGAIRTDGRRRGRLLVADDDADVLPVLVQLLRGAGHDVVPARDAEEAMAAIDGSARDVDVVLLDASLVGGGGEAIARTLARAAPRARLVLMSGDAREDVLGRFAGVAVEDFVGKPFERAALLEVVDRAVASAPGSR